MFSRLAYLDHLDRRVSAADRSTVRLQMRAALHGSVLSQQKPSPRRRCRTTGKASARHRHIPVTFHYCSGRIMAPLISRGPVMFNPISSDAIFAVFIVVDVVAIIGLAALFFWPRRWLGRLRPPAGRGRYLPRGWATASARISQHTRLVSSQPVVRSKNR